MCGIAGAIDPRRGRTADSLAAVGAAMAATLRHRGPDDGGVWTDAAAGVVLAHRRLSIVDLTAAGHQPMASSCGRVVVTYNGEIYNHGELRAALEARGRRFRGRSDTEVVVEACAEWGVEAAVGRFVGMFAFALWDRDARSLWLARDRIGIKPVYWGRFDGLFLFGSELKALRAHDGWTPEIDAGSLASYMCRGHVPAPASIYRDVFKLRPGHVLELPWDGAPACRPYWEPRRIAVAAQVDRLAIGAEEALDGFETHLRTAVRQRMVADVPLGAFLSGGVDSSAVVALMQAESGRTVNTYTIGFTDPRFDEAPQARAIAAHLGTAHTEIYATPEDALRLIPGLPRWFDEPFADASQLPTALVSELTRRHVTVALSGDGGDELLGGYKKYYKILALARLRRLLPAAAWRGAAVGVRRALPSFAALSRALPGGWRDAIALNRIEDIARALALPDTDAVYRHIFGTGMPAAAMIPRTRASAAADVPAIPDLLERMGYQGVVAGLPDGILTKVDRASMAFGLEVRVPLLDHRVVEYLWRLPPTLKFGDRRNSKALLRRLLYRHVPRALVDRPKRGFAVPIQSWLRGPLRDWAEDLLDEPRLSEGGLLDGETIRAHWRAHVTGTHDHHRFLWAVLMFQQWRRHNEAPSPVPGRRPILAGP